MVDLDLFVGRAVDKARLSEFCTPGESCLIGNYEYMYQRRFGVTDKLLERWEYGGVELLVTLELEDGVIRRVIVDKGRESETPRPRWTGMMTTDQELRVVRRLLEYLTTL